MIIPWFIVSIIDFLAWRLGYATYVIGVGGCALHRGRFGADSIHFRKRSGDEKRLPKLRARS